MVSPWLAGLGFGIPGVYGIVHFARHVVPQRPGHALRQSEIGHEPYDAEVLGPEAADRDLLWQNVVLERAPFFAKYEEKAGRTIPIAVLNPRARAAESPGQG